LAKHRNWANWRFGFYYGGFYFVTHYKMSRHATDHISNPVPYHPDQSNPLSRMAWRSAILGKTFVLGSSSPLNGLVLFPSANHFSISVRSYVCPSAVKTGSLITSIVNGHWKECKTKEATAPAAAGSARDMLSAGAGAGASSGAAADPRAAVEAAVSAAPDDPSEGV